MTTLFTNLILLGGLVFNFFLLSTSLNIQPGSGKEDKLIQKLKKQVENAGPHDWYVFSACAERCIENKSNMTLAYIWITESISINKNPFNLIVLGDYYAANNMPYEAINTYVDSMILSKRRNPMYVDMETINKIKAQRKILYHLK